MIDIAVLHQAGFESESAKMAEQLQCEVTTDQAGAGFVLQFNSGGQLGIIANGLDGNPFFIDYPRQARQPGKDPLMRAIGYQTESVLDATAGWATDAVTIASHDIAVTACERNPLVFALADAGLNHVASESVSQRLKLACIDSVKQIESLEHAPEVVYLDPMYPARASSAAPKKKLQILQGIYQLERYREKDIVQNETNLITLARQIAKRRVVVKRPHHAPPLAPQPSGSIETKLVRFDIYPPVASAMQTAT